MRLRSESSMEGEREELRLAGVLGAWHFLEFRWSLFVFGSERRRVTTIMEKETIKTIDIRLGLCH